MHTMIANPVRVKQRSSKPGPAARFLIAAAVLWGLGAGVASAYVGKSFLEVPGMSGDWKGENYKGWVSIESNFWKTTPTGVFRGRRRSPAFFSYPTAPRQGASEITIAIDKHNPALSRLMDRC